MDPSQIGVWLIFFSFFVAVNISKADFDNRRISKICNGEHNNNVDFGICEGKLLFKIEEEARFAELHDVYGKKCEDSEDVRVFVHAVCTSSLTDLDCFDCLRSASDQLIEECTDSVGAQIQLMDCRVRVEQYQFYNDG